MAKKVTISVEELKSWDEVDNILRKIAECEIGIETIVADMNIEINDAKLKADKLGKPMKNAIAVYEAQVKSFVDSHKEDISGKSRDMNFGSVGYRQSTSITYATSKTAEILEKLKKLNMYNCITVKESPNKEVLRTYSDKVLEKLGVKRKIEDHFYYEVDKENLKD